jgi:hypothetical protein
VIRHALGRQEYDARIPTFWGVFPDFTSDCKRFDWFASTHSAGAG